MTKNGVIMFIMENELEIFVAWLIKYIKDDKRITGKKLAGLVSCDPTTISSYIRRRTKPDFDMRVNILKVLDVDYNEMLKGGRAVMSFKPPPQTNAPPNQKPTCQEKLNDLQKKQDQNFWGLMNEYQDRKSALEINKMIIEIEKMAGPLGLGRAMGKIESLRDEFYTKLDHQLGNGTTGGS